jgi:hypothetical protein
MRPKLDYQAEQQPKSLTTSDIRTLVEGVAETLMQQAGADGVTRQEGGLEATPIDTGTFVKLMSPHIRMN